MAKGSRRRRPGSGRRGEWSSAVGAGRCLARRAGENPVFPADKQGPFVAADFVPAPSVTGRFIGPEGKEIEDGESRGVFLLLSGSSGKEIGPRIARNGCQRRVQISAQSITLETKPPPREALKERCILPGCDATSGPFTLSESRFKTLPWVGMQMGLRPCCRREINRTIS